MSRGLRGTSKTSRPSTVTPAMPIVCACWVSSPRRMTRPLSHWSWCSGRWDGTCQLSTIIQSGVDVARFGDDRTALAKRQANKLLEPVKSWNSTDLMATAGKIKAEYDATPYDARPSEILVDIIGLGAGVYDRCKELGLPVRGVNVGEAAASRENCARLRDELWFKGPGVVPGPGVLNAKG